ncbi:MAG: hypothetical protein J6X83_01970 [Methanomicrobium sp.]|nr:hypothetical protein [Methanomicrobium sp.]
MTTEAQKRANAKYDLHHTKQIKLKLNIKTDADIIAKLETVPAVQTYIKDLIRKDISGRNSVEFCDNS